MVARSRLGGRGGGLRLSKPGWTRSANCPSHITCIPDLALVRVGGARYEFRPGPKLEGEEVFEVRNVVAHPFCNGLSFRGRQTARSVGQKANIKPIHERARAQETFDRFRPRNAR